MNIVIVKSVIFILSISLSFNLLGQVKDDFTDGDYTANPIWSGDDSKFVITGGQLNSFNTGSATYYLSTASTLALEAEWEFFVNFKFGTSGANFGDIYLVSDQANLVTAMNGYFVRVGNTKDEISLYKIVSGVEAVLIDGTDKLVNSSSSNPFNIRVRRDGSDLWTLEIDDGATGSYTIEGSAVDGSISSGTHFGVKIKQSSASSPVNNHFFDNISVREVVPDTTPPSLSSVDVVSLTAIDLVFDEPLDKSAVEMPVSYSIDKGIGQPVTVLLDPVNASLVHLTFESPLTNGEAHEVSVKNIADLNGNISMTQTVAFDVLVAEVADAEDIIITEIMADPTPSNGLPEEEYVEIFNKSDKYIDLAGYLLSGADIATVKKFIRPNQYIILCDDSDAPLFEPYGEVIGIPSWNSLTNSGETIVLQDTMGMIVDQVSYNVSWYQSIDKNNGGWSLELIDPRNECGEESNWTASTGGEGGTPGGENSVFGNKPDLTGPSLLSAQGIADSIALLRFDERLDTATIRVDRFSFDPELPVSDMILSSNAREVAITFGMKLKAQQGYTVTVTGISDCNGNLIGEQNKGTFGLAEEAEAGDVLINELLYNPRTSGGDFVEIYNASKKYINLRGWSIANGEDGTPENLETVTTNHLIIKPLEYLVLTEEPLAVASDYPQGVVGALVEVDALPSFPNDGQGVYILDSLNVLLDHFIYQEDMHHELLDDTKGVSLERLSIDDPANDPNNWHSAAKSVGFATPGYLNSQAIERSTSQGAVTVSPEVFLPNQAGADDFTTISYVLDQAGYIGTVLIVDASGRTVKTIANNQLLAVEGFFQWNGTMDNGRKARSAPYMVYFEVFDSSGNVVAHKKRVVIAPEI